MSEEINNNENIGPVEHASRCSDSVTETEPVQEIETGKKKKQLSEHQIEHLNKIRVKALERKREIKLQKHKQYEEECRKKRQDTQSAAVTLSRNIKQVPLNQSVEPVKEPVKEEPKKKKTVKKIIKYVEESDDDEAEEIEEVIVKKSNKPKPQQAKQTENQYADLLYNSSLDRLRERMLNERAKTLVSNVIPCYF